MYVNVMSVSRLLLEQMILYLRYGFGIMTCAVSPLFRNGGSLSKTQCEITWFPYILCISMQY